MQTTAGVASSRQELKAAPGTAFSRQESPAVVRMKRFCLEFFFLYTKSLFFYFLLNSFDFIILNRQIFFSNVNTFSFS